MNTYMTLVDVGIALAEMPKRAKVVFDTGDPFGDIHSYRGFYDELAVAPYREDDAPAKSRKDIVSGEPYLVHAIRVGKSGTVAQVGTAIDMAIGQSFQGYKGGEFYMDGSETLHVAGYGATSDIFITGVRLDGTRVVLDTTIDEGVFC